MPRKLACVEVGGSGAQTVLFDGADAIEIRSGAMCPPEFALAIACPGIVDAAGVDATNLGWTGADPARELGLVARPVLVMNDAVAAALGEVALLDEQHDLLYIGLGTGIGGARVIDGSVVADNLFGHQTGFGERPCRCGRSGCLETIAAGWALPGRISADGLEAIAAGVAAAVEREPRADAKTVVVAGGIIDRHPRLLDLLGDALIGRRLLATARPAGAKSAAPWGLRAEVPT